MKGEKYKTKNQLDNIEEVIQFAKWLRLECDFNSIYLFDYKGKNLNLEELLIIYRQKNK